MTALARTAGRLSAFPIAHDLFTPKVAHLRDAAVSSATAAISINMAFGGIVLLTANAMKWIEKQ